MFYFRSANISLITGTSKTNQPTTKRQLIANWLKSCANHQGNQTPQKTKATQYLVMLQPFDYFTKQPDKRQRSANPISTPTKPIWEELSWRRRCVESIVRELHLLRCYNCCIVTLATLLKCYNCYKCYKCYNSYILTMLQCYNVTILQCYTVDCTVSSVYCVSI